MSPGPDIPENVRAWAHILCRLDPKHSLLPADLVRLNLDLPPVIFLEKDEKARLTRVGGYELKVAVHQQLDSGSVVVLARKAREPHHEWKLMRFEFGELLRCCLAYQHFPTTAAN